MGEDFLIPRKDYGEVETAQDYDVEALAQKFRNEAHEALITREQLAPMTTSKGRPLPFKLGKQALLTPDPDPALITGKPTVLGRLTDQVPMPLLERFDRQLNDAAFRAGWDEMTREDQLEFEHKIDADGNPVEKWPAQEEIENIADAECSRPKDHGALRCEPES